MSFEFVIGSTVCLGKGGGHFMFMHCFSFCHYCVTIEKQNDKIILLLLLFFLNKYIYYATCRLGGYARTAEPDITTTSNYFQHSHQHKPWINITNSTMTVSVDLINIRVVRHFQIRLCCDSQENRTRRKHPGDP